MLVDLHVHTNVSSPCSQIDPRQLLTVAERIGLDAVCVTEHDEMEGAEIAWRLGQERGFRVFRGVEVYTEFGDMLVFGLYRPSFGIKTPFSELLREVREAEGPSSPAIPAGVPWGFHHSLGAEDAEYLLASVDAIETRNGGSSPESNLAAEAMAEKYSLPGIGGSDAHFLMQVGRCLTVFERELHDEKDLIAEIKAGRCRAAYAAEVESLRMSEMWG